MEIYSKKKQTGTLILHIQWVILILHLVTSGVKKYTMYEGQKEAWMPGPWAMVHLLVDPETGSNYTAPGVGANGMQGTSPAEAGVFKRDNTAFYADVEYDMDDLLVRFPF